jgi:hypothetical protein
LDSVVGGALMADRSPDVDAAESMISIRRIDAGAAREAQ